MKALKTTPLMTTGEAMEAMKKSGRGRLSPAGRLIDTQAARTPLPSCAAVPVNGFGQRTPEYTRSSWRSSDRSRATPAPRAG